MNTVQIIATVLATIFIVLFSWFVSLKQGRYHGIYRFFSFESITIMIILNIPVWFKDPFSPLQIISWIFLFGCIPVAIGAFMFLISMGKPKGTEFEATTKIVATGMYKYIRHPMYCSLLLFGFGVFFKHVNTVTIILVVANTVALYLTALVEQGEMTKRFGKKYKEYMKKTKMFIPYIL
jgi:protein-S-isoprenylcysteine O-methyltransferase Ste14